MSIFSSIKDAIFGKAAAAATPPSAAPVEQAAPAEAAPAAPAAPVDVEATCAAMAGADALN